MKRAKIMLTAITVLAVIGGALAFKANTFQSKQLFYITTTNDIGGTTCTTSGSVSTAVVGSPINNPKGNLDWYTTETCPTAVFGYAAVE